MALPITGHLQRVDRKYPIAGCQQGLHPRPTVGSKCSATSSCSIVMPANPSDSRRRASTRPDSSSISMSWWASAQSSPINSTAPPRSRVDQQGSSRGEDLLRPNGSVLTGTTSHQHSWPPHHLPGHDLVIDLNWAWPNECSPAAGSDISIP